MFRSNKGSANASILGTLFVLIMWFAVIIGWGLNIVKLTQCDFKPSYKAEIIRGIGVFAFPVGVIAGYTDIED